MVLRQDEVQFFWQRREEVEAAEREISRNPRFCVLCRLYCGDVVCVCVVCFCVYCRFKKTKNRKKKERKKERNQYD
ncbi:hypothetical protein OIU79_006380 [Salix purpurea]|uniref:Uncharacterized protein n=1 Tax=Salix purpurea TaxID=77065 RepID=A0A9Q0TV79_SALPP|nr:hypothetical protein OIU79_006380 [Salix purpurea]